MARIKSTVIAGTDNDATFVLKIDGVTIDHTLITAARLLFDSVGYLDSTQFPDAWDFGHPDQITVRLGRGDLQVGRYQDGRLITVDLDHPQGLAWDSVLEIHVQQATT